MKRFSMLGVLAAILATGCPVFAIPGNIQEWKVATLFNGVSVQLRLNRTTDPAIYAKNNFAGNIRVLKDKKPLTGAKLTQESERVRIYKFDSYPEVTFRFEMDADNYIHCELLNIGATPLSIEIALNLTNIGADKLWYNDKKIGLNTRGLGDVKSLMFFKGDAKKQFEFKVDDGTDGRMYVSGKYFTMTLNPGANGKISFTIVPGFSR